MAHHGRPRKCDPKVDALHSNIRLGHFNIARATLNEFGIDATDGHGRTALIHSVFENKFEFVRWLTHNGANIHHQDRIGYSSLHFAAQEKHVDIARFLLEKGADPNLPDIHGNTSLWTAVFNAKSIIEEQGGVKLLLKFGANPNLVNKHGRTAKMMYQTFNNKDIETLDLS
jgi:ankyrin repeat protein